MQLDIVIVNWNSGGFLERCIKSVYTCSIVHSFNIIVVDNGSIDGSMKNIPVADREILVECKINHGFAKACNLGASKSHGEYILFLNPDTVVLPDSIERATMLLAGNSDIGIVGVRQLSDNGDLLHSCSRFLRLRYLLNDLFGLTRLFPSRIKHSTIMFEWDHSRSSIVDQVMGSFMLMRRRDFEMVGGFDERFFVYFEEMDLAKRFLEAGLKSYYLNDVSIYHYGGGSSEKVKDKRLFYNLSSRVLYARKHLSRIEYSLIILTTLTVEPFARIINSLLFKWELSESTNTLRGYYMLFRWIIKTK